MGHRHTFNAPKNFENESHQRWNHAEQPYIPLDPSINTLVTRPGAPESSSIIHPVDNMIVQGGPYPPPWAPTPRPNVYSSPIPNVELSHYQLIPTIAPVPSHVPLPPTTSGNPHMFQENYPHRPSSSNIGMDSAFYNQAVGSGGGPYKRKSPSIPPIYERGSTSRYYDVGSSSDIQLPADPWEKQSIESYHTHWDYCPPSYGGNTNSLSISGEGSQHQMRNVRSRSTVDPETNIARINSYQPSDQSGSVDFWAQSSNAPAVHDSGFFCHDPHQLNTMNNHPNSSAEIASYSNDFTFSRELAPQNVSSNLNQYVRGVRTGYGQRSTPTHRPSSSSNFWHGQQLAAPNEGQRVAESYHSRYPMVLPNADRDLRTSISNDRYRHFTDEGVTFADNNAFYGSRIMFDQHMEMRLDIDDMGYEELLALGERIGSVNTGLSEDLISKCMVECVYCWSDPSHDEGSCVICLDEYKNMDDVGTLKGCRHDFHVGCIRKWLSMKNSCPICKAAAADGTKKNEC